MINQNTCVIENSQKNISGGIARFKQRMQNGQTISSNEGNETIRKVIFLFYIIYFIVKE